jgi:class 3 adenylate cyclase
VRQLIDSATASDMFALTGNSTPLRKCERIDVAVLFADIVGSTELLVKIGDDSWAQLLEKYYDLAGKCVLSFQGQLQRPNGDGFHACFEHPSQAVRSGYEMRRSMKAIGLKMRIGVHFGECVKVNGFLAGLTLHVGSRIATAAEADELLVSESSKERLQDLQLNLVERGRYCFKGLPGKWRLFNYVSEN